MKRKLFILLAILATAFTAQAENYILYTSTDGQVVQPYDETAFGATIVSNTCEDGQGKIEYDAEVTRIGQAAFLACTNLKTIELPNSVQEIGDAAFAWCPSLEAVEMPNSVTSIGNLAFAIYSPTEKRPSSWLEYPGKTVSFDEYKQMSCMANMRESRIETFYNRYIENDSVGSYLKYLADVSTNANNQEIYTSETPDYSSLKALTIPASVTSIGTGAFSFCTKLQSVTIPHSVNNIGAWAFNSCTGLTELVSLSTTPPIASGTTFREIPTETCVLKVPEEAVELYKSYSGWRNFQKFVGLTEEEITGIESIDTTPSAASMNGQTYTLSGQRASEGYKGILVKDGRKVLRK